MVQDLLDGDILGNFEDENLTVSILDDNITSINGAIVEKADMDATNGVIHLLGDLLLPPWANISIANVLFDTPELAQLACLLDNSDLQLLEQDEGPWTLLAPTNFAFEDWLSANSSNAPLAFLTGRLTMS